MRKHKTTLAILLSVMMVFVMMPSMAFAETWNWEDGKGYSTVTNDTGYTFSTNIAFNDSTAMSTARGVDVEADNTTIPAVEAASAPSNTMSWYDFSGSKLVSGKKTFTSTSVSQATFENYLNVTGTANYTAALRLYQPSYTYGYNSSNVSYVDYEFAGNLTKGVTTSMGNWTLTMKASSYTSGATEDQDVTISVTAKSTTPGEVIDGQDGNGIIVGEFTPVTFTVAGKAKTYKDATMLIDGAAVTSNYNVTGWTYDGSEHTLTVSDTGDNDGKYYVYSDTAAKYVEQDLTFKNAGNYTYKAVSVNASNTSQTQMIANTTAEIKKAKKVRFTFIEDGNGGNYTYNVTEGEWAPEDFVIAVANTTNTADASSLAVAAEQEELLEYFNEKYEITQSSSLASPNVITLTIKAKSSYDVSAYESLLANYNGEYIPTEKTATGNNSYTATVNVQSTPVVDNTKEDDITFSGVTSKTYKAVKKTKKLKKTKSFTVAAVADSGNAITYTATSSSPKISINAETGKVTIKKGLKKGTYKLVVKAKTAAGNGYKACKETKTYTIKVK